MAGKNKKQSASVPTLVAALLADAAARDPSTNKTRLIGIFDRLWALKLPTKRSLTVYFKISDAIGKYEVGARLVHLKSGKVLATALGPFSSKDKLMTHEFVIPMHDVPFSVEGRYAFQILANDAYLGSTVITVEKAVRQGV